MLTETLIRKTEPTEKPQKLRDGHGLYLLVQPNDARWWRWDYSRPVTGKRNSLSFGTYPLVTLAEARERHTQARILLMKGIDPGEQRKANKAEKLKKVANSFKVVANELLAMRAKTLSAQTASRDRYLLNELARYIGSKPITEIDVTELLTALRKIESARTLRTAHNARILAGQIFRYAIVTGRAERNPANDLTGALAPLNTGHFASITDPKKVRHLLRALWGYSGSPSIAAALKLAPLVFVRPNELRRAQWADIDLESAQWRFIASKTEQPHIVPLAKQAVAILHKLQSITGDSEYVFPSLRKDNRPISDSGLLAALRTMEIDSKDMTMHGFRAMARTLLDEVLGFRADYIEHQLGHRVRDPLGRAYNRTQYLAERKRMMQVWADYLDQLRLKSTGVAAIASKFSEAKRGGA